MAEPAPRHLAITSYLPGAPNWDPHWPQTGRAERATTIETLPRPALVSVQDLPAQHPEHLHFQGGARWVVLGIAPADYESENGFVHFSRGEVLFNGTAPDACAYLRSLGVSPPSSHRQLLDAGDWGAGKVGDHSIVIGGFDARVGAGDHSLAYAQRGEVRAGGRAFALSTYGEVSAGTGGIAITIDGPAARAGELGLARVGEFGQASVGGRGVAIADTGGRAECGPAGVALGLFGARALAGDSAIALVHDPGGSAASHAAAGKEGIAVNATGSGSAQAGVGGVLIFLVHDGARLRAHVAHVGEDGILADTPYSLDERGRIVPAKA